MQAVILAAGRGTRMGELTATVPKPMLKVGDKTLIEHKLDILPQEIDEVIIVVGYLGHVIQQHFGGAYCGKRILYAEQENPTGGTANALWKAKDILQGRFLVLNGDDIYAADDIAACIKEKEWVVLVEEAAGPKSGGKVVLDKQGHVSDIQEGAHEGNLLLNTNTFVLDTRVFAQEPVPKAPGSAELGLPQTVLAACLTQAIDLVPVSATKLIQITAPEDIAAAEKALGYRVF